MATTEYQVTGMTCGHCEMAIRSEVGQIAGISDIQVSAADGHLTVQTDGDAPADDAAVLSAVDEAGYEARRLS
ncbi:heavy-metal-associated domain-containing protein [Agrococcus sp. ARC_14]|uniref:heavy-metal-associated domain-containing protein n=1 Tax=Agrococcus sp. ARC_14 TaxID=2919927 RepID=UPI001F0581BB|nr:heavy-metal-associated domain-containing protein [Agrococcus sp. ARC_14]MCH1884002.1 heavy-metal-associated domain-containing protein [Agrococcus sp. ARC_14]